MDEAHAEETIATGILMEMPCSPSLVVLFGTRPVLPKLRVPSTPEGEGNVECSALIKCWYDSFLGSQRKSQSPSSPSSSVRKPCDASLLNTKQ